MDSKITLTIVVISLVAFGLIAAATFAGTDEASAKKSCKSKKWSHCKGDKGYYTVNGHHHCYESEGSYCKKSYH
jgi:hypothetical protein